MSTKQNDKQPKKDNPEQERGDQPSWQGPDNLVDHHLWIICGRPGQFEWLARR